MDEKDLGERGEPKGPVGPPELPGSASPQLIKSTKPAEPVLPPEDEAAEPDELNELVEEPGDPDGLVAAEERQQWQERHPAPPATPVVAKRKRRWPKVLLTLIIIAAATAGAYWFGNHKASAPAPKISQTTQTQSQQQAKAAAVATKHYDSTTYTLGFDYPQTWAVSDTASKLTVTSPATQLTGADGKALSAHVVVTIQNQQTTIPGYPADGAIAELASDKLSYKQPTAVQRAQTYLSYLGYHKTNGLDVLYITGDTGYQQGQQVPMSDIVRGNPLVSVSFETCSSDCTTGTPTLVTLQASNWKDAAASKQVIDLLQSMQLD